MRRLTHEDTYLGYPLLKLPGIVARTQTVNLSPPEAYLYHEIKEKLANKVHGKAGNDTKRKENKRTKANLTLKKMPRITPIKRKAF